MSVFPTSSQIDFLKLGFSNSKSKNVLFEFSVSKDFLEFIRADSLKACYFIGSGLFKFNDAEKNFFIRQWPHFSPSVQFFTIERESKNTTMDIEKSNNEIYLNVLALKCEKKWQKRFVVSVVVNILLLCICAFQSFSLNKV